MIIFEFLFGLLTSFPIWLVVGLVFSVRYYRKPENKNAPLARDAALWVVIAVLVTLNLLFIPVHITSIFNAGPTSGTVVDAKTGKLVPGATVILDWQARGKIPIAVPWWAYLLPNPSCSVTIKMFTDARGRYSAPWIGQRTWKGCIKASLTVSAPGYEYYRFPFYEDGKPNGRAAAPFSKMLIELVPERAATKEGNP